MKISIKSSPEDFYVEEVLNVKPKAQGKYALYVLTKSGWNTVDALRLIARTCQVPFKLFQYAGRKDRHALTKQFITFEGSNLLHFKHADIYIEPVGFLDVPLSADLIAANRFMIKVRGIKKELHDDVIRQFKIVERVGFINYFDDQRFGGWDPIGGFLGEKIIKQHYNSAVKILLTAIHPEDKKHTKERKQFFIKHWRNWQICLTKAQTPTEIKMLELLINETKPYIKILQDVPREEVSMAFSAYQSYLWNEHVRRLLKMKCPESLKAVNGVVGEYLFFEQLPQLTYDYLRHLRIPTLGARVQFSDRINEIIYEKIIKEQEIVPHMIKEIPLKQAFLKSVTRELMVKPRDIVTEKFPDFLKVAFTLPRGSYATMLIKRIIAYV